MCNLSVTQFPLCDVGVIIPPISLRITGVIHACSVLNEEWGI